MDLQSNSTPQQSVSLHFWLRVSQCWKFSVCRTIPPLHMVAMSPSRRVFPLGNILPLFMLVRWMCSQLSELLMFVVVRCRLVLTLSLEAWSPFWG